MMKDTSGKNTSNNSASKGVIIALIVAMMIIVVLIAVIIYLYAHRYTGDTAPDGAAAQNVPEGTPAADSEEVINALDMVEAAQETAPKRPSEWYGTFESSGGVETDVDLGSYIDVCPDVYAFIEIPGTDVNYPIVYCEDAVDPFYFSHDIDGNPSETGMIITDSMNGRIFSDPETLIYGKAPDDGTMFAQLSQFKDADFFDEHDTINIYLDDAELVYGIYACYTGSSDHILVNNDFKDPIQFMRFFDSIEDVRDLAKNIRDDAKPVPGDHVIALVTHCGDESKRLFVQAVLRGVKY